MSTALDLLREQGFTNMSPSICPKCGQPTLDLESFDGTKMKWAVNSGGHWDPFVLHPNTCGQPSPEVRLPPPVDQEAKLKEIQQAQAQLRGRASGDV